MKESNNVEYALDLIEGLIERKLLLKEKILDFIISNRDCLVGLKGQAAIKINMEYDFLFDYIQSRKPYTREEIITNVKRLKDSPFRFNSERGEANEIINQRLDELVKSDVIYTKSDNKFYAEKGIKLWKQ